MKEVMIFTHSSKVLRIDLTTQVTYLIYMPLCVRNVHYVTVVLQKHVSGKTNCYVLDSTGREIFFSAGRQTTVNLLYTYIVTTRLRLNPEIMNTTEKDVAIIRDIEDQLKITASMSLTPSVTMKISELERSVENISPTGNQMA